MKNIGIVFTSRNNYELLDNWMTVVNVENFSILNIDEDSSEDNKRIGREICKKHNITYMDRDKRGMQWNMKSASEYFKQKDIEWLLWFQHDCFPLTENFFSSLNDLLSKGTLNNFGVIGFNGHHTQKSHKRYENGFRDLNDTARTPLEIGDMWYRKKEYWPNTKVDYSMGFDKPFAVESVAWYSAMVNIDMYMKHIIPTDDYHFFHAWDDIAFQFLYNNIYNICVPQFDILHHQGSKKEFDIPTNSPKAGEMREHYYSKWGHLEVWKDRWGFDYGNRNTFENVKEHYKGTLLWEFYHHNPADGPLRSFDI